jgi:hypothetical protein
MIERKTVAVGSRFCSWRAGGRDARQALSSDLRVLREEKPRVSWNVERIKR